MASGTDSWAPGYIQASFAHSAQLYDRASKNGVNVAIPFGRYLLTKRIKRGGMAEIYRAKMIGTEGFEKTVAIKRILPHLASNEEFVRMFIDEAKIVSYLNHQNICSVIELGRCSDGLYIVMEYIWGQDIRQIMNSLSIAGRLMPLNIVAYIVARIAEGLDYAHRRTDYRGQSFNIIHRDISPQNVLLSYDGEVKIIDFGIATANRRSTETQSGTFKGKFAYMSPEQAHGRSLDQRSDIFSLGILLYEMISGKRLFARKNELETLQRVRQCSVSLPNRPFEEVAHELKVITMKALQANPKNRFSRAGEMQEALDRYLVMSGEIASLSKLGTWICLNFAEHAAHALAEQERMFQRCAPSDSSQGSSSVNGGNKRIIEKNIHDSETKIDNRYPEYANPIIDHDIHFEVDDELLTNEEEFDGGLEPYSVQRGSRTYSDSYTPLAMELKGDHPFRTSWNDENDYEPEPTPSHHVAHSRTINPKENSPERERSRSRSGQKTYTRPRPNHPSSFSMDWYQSAQSKASPESSDKVLEISDEDLIDVDFLEENKSRSQK